MSKKELEPLTLQVSEDLLGQLVACGTEHVLGFKLCRLLNEPDIGEGINKVTLRVCGGPMNIPCQCEAMRQNTQKMEAEQALPIANKDLYRDEDY